MAIETVQEKNKRLTKEVQELKKGKRIKIGCFDVYQ